MNVETNLDYDVLVIGGGAAGYFTAIQCAARAPHAKIAILEATGKTLTKVRISGGGRCNVTHHEFVPKVLVAHYPRGHKELLGPFHRFGPRETIAWFEEQGVRLVPEPDGRMFPESNTSETIVGCLETQIARYHIDRLTMTLVEEVVPLEGGGFLVRTRKGQEFRCGYLVVATGGAPLGHKIAQNLGLSVIPPVPSLFTFQIEDPILRQRSGVALGPPLTPFLTLSVATSEGIKVFQQKGPVLITHWGLSGPAILRLSAYAARELFAAKYQAHLEVNWLYPLNAKEISQKLVEMKKNHGKKQVATIHPFIFAKSFWEYILAKQQIPSDRNYGDLNQDEISRLSTGLAQDSCAVTGKGVFKEEFVTAGGVSCDEINFKNMATKSYPRLYFVGEVLDIDGVTGGFNFQNAWTGGALAGQDLGAKLEVAVK